jgi:hypothetical protein
MSIVGEIIGMGRLLGDVNPNWDAIAEDSSIVMEAFAAISPSRRSAVVS